MQRAKLQAKKFTFLRGMYLSEYMDALEDNDIGHETPKYEDLYQQCGLGNQSKKNFPILKLEESQIEKSLEKRHRTLQIAPKSRQFSSHKPAFSSKKPQKEVTLRAQILSKQKLTDRASVDPNSVKKVQFPTTGQNILCALYRTNLMGKRQQDPEHNDHPLGIQPQPLHRKSRGSLTKNAGSVCSKNIKQYEQLLQLQRIKGSREENRYKNIGVFGLKDPIYERKQKKSKERRIG